MHRLRWDNIARAAAVLAVVALVVAWPHLKGAPPSLPPAAATPVSIEDPPPPPAPEPREAEPRPRPAKHRRARRRAPQHAARVIAVASPAPTSPPAPAPIPAPPPAPAAPPAPSASDLAAHEFAVP